jgi:arylsulfatase A-like enzyme
VEENKERPFFLYWSLITPHANNEGTKHSRGQEVPDLGAYADKPWPQPDRAHAATITRLDADIGRLLAKLKELGLDEHTLVIFSSDNGHHKEGGNDPELFDANGPLRGMKRDLYEGGIRVPTVARWPGKVRAGATESRLLWFADILPTFAYLGGAHEFLPANLDGISFASLLLNLPHTPASRGDLYWEFHERGFSQAVIMDGRWKAIRKKQMDAAVELYDLDNDPGEERDVAKEQAALVTRASELFKSARADSPDWPIKLPPAGK